MNPTESMEYRESLYAKGNENWTEEDRRWIACNPYYSKNFGEEYYRKDVIKLIPNTKYLITLKCLHHEPSYPIVPVLSIPECHSGYVRVDVDRYPDIPPFNKVPRKLSTKLSVRVWEQVPGYLLHESDGGILCISFQAFIPVEQVILSRWWESTDLSSLAMTREQVSSNQIRYGCNSAGRRPELLNAPPAFDKYIFTVEWEPVSADYNAAK